MPAVCALELGAKQEKAKVAANVRTIRKVVLPDATSLSPNARASLRATPVLWYRCNFTASLGNRK
jgi:hypothetical protein